MSAAGESKPKQQAKGGRVKRNEINATAAHVLKGACTTVLGATAALTASVLYSSAAKGSLVLELAAEADGTPPPKPTDEQLAAIVAAANDCIRRDVPVQTHLLTRADAESRFTGDGAVNHCALHDKPARVNKKDADGEEAKSGTDDATVSVVEIADWTVNCCTGSHAASTGALMAMSVNKMKYKPKTRLLELVFEVGERVVPGPGEKSATVTAATASSGPTAASVAAKSAKAKAAAAAAGGDVSKGTKARKQQQQPEPAIFNGCGIGTRPVPEQTSHDVVARVVAMLRPTTEDGRVALAAALAASASEADTTTFVSAALGDHVTDACAALQNAAYAKGYASAAYGGAAGVVDRNKQRWYAHGGKGK